MVFFKITFFWVIGIYFNLFFHFFFISFWLKLKNIFLEISLPWLINSLFFITWLTTIIGIRINNLFCLRSLLKDLCNPLILWFCLFLVNRHICKTILSKTNTFLIFLQILVFRIFILLIWIIVLYILVLFIWSFLFSF